VARTEGKNMPQSATDYLQPLLGQLEANANPDEAIPMAWPATGTTSSLFTALERRSAAYWSGDL